MSRGLQYYVSSNIHIALCAALFVSGSYRLFRIEVDYYLLAFVFLATYLTYNLHRIIGLIKYVDTDEQQLPPRFLFVKDHLSVLLISSFICGIGVLILYSQLSLPDHYIITLAVATMAYLIPVFPGFRRLRDLPYIKIFLISFVWAGIFMIPYFENNKFIDLNSFIIFFEKFLFIIALTIPFDRRDRSIDQSVGLSTFATSWNNRRLEIIGATILLSVFSCQYFLFLNNILTLFQLFLLAIFGLLTYSLGYRVIKKEDYYYLFYLDGLILINGLIYWV